MTEPITTPSSPAAMLLPVILLIAVLSQPQLKILPGRTAPKAQKPQQRTKRRAPIQRAAVQKRPTTKQTKVPRGHLLAQACPKGVGVHPDGHCIIVAAPGTKEGTWYQLLSPKETKPSRFQPYGFVQIKKNLASGRAAGIGFVWVDAVQPHKRATLVPLTQQQREMRALNLCYSLGYDTKMFGRIKRFPNKYKRWRREHAMIKRRIAIMRMLGHKTTAAGKPLSPNLSRCNERIQERLDAMFNKLQAEATAKATTKPATRPAAPRKR